MATKAVGEQRELQERENQVRMKRAETQRLRQRRLAKHQRDAVALRVGVRELRDQWEDSLVKNSREVGQQMSRCAAVLSKMQHDEHEAIRRKGSQELEKAAAQHRTQLSQLTMSHKESMSSLRDELESAATAHSDALGL